MKGSMSRFSFQHSTSNCDICGKPRNRGQGPAWHDRCSKVRQTRRHVLTLLEQDLTGVQIARLLGCTPQVVSYYKATYLN